MSPRTTRRTFLGTLAATTVAAALPKPTSAQSVPAAGGFRFVFMPCVHLRRDRRSPDGFRSAMTAVAALDPAPDFILTGGDMCHNLRDQSLEQSVEMVDLFAEILGAGFKKPVHHCLGNHDLAAWNNKDAAGDPRYGKRLTIQKLGMPGPYHSFDHGGWHFVALDYMFERGPGDFSPEFGAEQMAWLRDDLAKTAGRPTIIVSHAPVASAVELFSDRATVDDKSRAVPFGRVVKDTPALFEAVVGANVRAFLSGHLHLVEELNFDGHRLICSGSVSGHQWGGPRMGTPEGFGVLDCQPDATLQFSYQSHNWTAVS